MATHQKYFDSAGKQVPSVTTILSRYKDSGGLLYWANKAGLDGKTLDEARKPAADAGTLAHDMVEAHLHSSEFIAPPGTVEDVLAKARSAFDAYLKWGEMSRLEIRYTEVPLVSEIHRFGGRLDALGYMLTEFVLVDWKTSNAVYADYTQQLAAYKVLWEENYPELPIAGFHLLRFAKEEGDFSHHYFPKLDREEEAFLLKRKLYDIDKACEKRVK